MILLIFITNIGRFFTLQVVVLLDRYFYFCKICVENAFRINSQVEMLNK